MNPSKLISIGLVIGSELHINYSHFSQIWCQHQLGEVQLAAKKTVHDLNLLFCYKSIHYRVMGIKPFGECFMQNLISIFIIYTIGPFRCEQAFSGCLMLQSPFLTAGSCTSSIEFSAASIQTLLRSEGGLSVKEVY